MMEEAANMTDDASFLIQNSEKPEEIKKWDVFYSLPYEEEDQTKISKFLKVCTKFLKFLSYIITMAVVLGTAVLAKASFLLMAAMARPNQRLPVCVRGDDSSKEYELTVNEAETRAWIWCLYFVSIVPDALTLLRSIRICVFKSFSKPQLWTTLALVFLFQTFHSIGFSLLVFLVFPRLYSGQATMLTNCVCFLPSVLQLLSRHRSEKVVSIKIILDSITIFSQASGLVFFLIAERPTHNTRWFIPVALFLTSFYWWENFIHPASKFQCVQKLHGVKEDLHRSRYFISIFVSLWKMALTLATMLCVSSVSVKDLFGRFGEGFGNIPNNISRTLYSGDSGYQLLTERQADFVPWEQILSDGKLPIYVAVFHLLVGWICYVFAKFACRTCIQGFGFSLPLHLTTPVVLFWISLSCQQKLINVCHASFFSDYVFWACPGRDAGFQLFNLSGFLWLAWLLSQMWLTLHVWTPKSERLASTDKLFVNPMYCGALMDQSLLLNRRKYETEYEEKDATVIASPRSSVPVEVDHFYENLSDHRITTDGLTRIYACATMWHETKDEMNQLLKSLFRMDEDQCARRHAMKFLQVTDVDYYEFEAHVLFDDAFEEDDNGPVINQFVRLLIKEIETAASTVHECHIQLLPPKVIPTPYGGKLIWTMPGKNQLIVHLKDKSKIRHKKRWSQVMYMYYLLGFGIMELKIDSNRKSVRTENTYILALDGDINFRPYAVQLLVDLMKKNPVLGAACGRIHPVGSGPMAWYQMFEYAVGHWLQKATEHMIGCVLCSPGCFSLFRAKALMDDNVMKKYTTMSEEARHYVQYDQGEDRWLCTLLLQRGYRVEYCAASDAYTHCPEGFGEFYNQRRRWAPSTMANIMDLLADYKRIVSINDNISMPYIIYQLMLMIGSILGPSTIFLMLVGAMVAAFRIPTVQALLANLIPIVFFILVCFFTKNDFQILIAQIVSALYALLMMAVLVGTAVQLVEDGPASPSAIFLLALTSSFVISALLHPQEILCLFHGVLYFLSVPSMYLFLFLFSLINLNNVSWGTREIQKPTKSTLEEQQTQIKKMKDNSALDWLANFGFGKGSEEEDGGISCSLSNFFKCMFCTYPKANEQKYQLLIITEKLDSINKQLLSLENSFDKPKISAFRRKSSLGKKMISFKEEEEDRETEDEECYEEPTVQDEYNFNFNTTKKTFDEKRDDLINPYWIDDEDLRYGQVEFAEDSEIKFWSDLIQKYLFPIEQNKAHQDKVASELKELRNKVVFAFLMINSLFVLAVFLLQVNKKNLHLKWPLGIKYSITYMVSSRQVRIQEHSLEIDPIGIVFVSFFAIILIIQFIGMLFHRLATVTHILASEELRCCLRKFENISDQAHFDRNAVQIAREIQKMQGINGSDHIIKEDEKFIGRRNTIIALENRQSENRKKIKTLDDAFIKRYSCISENTRQDSPLLKNLQRLNARRGTLKILEDRRNSVLREIKRKSTVARECNEPLNEDESMLKLMKAFSQANGKLPPSNQGVENAAFEEESF